MVKSWNFAVLIAGSLAAMQPAVAACPSVATSVRFTALNNGAELRDNATGLIWARCPVGYSWNGSTCLGTSNPYFMHEAALAYAASLTGWRLPNRRELFSLADRGCLDPAIDPTAFPATGSLQYWTTTPVVDNSGSAWVVDFFAGELVSATRTTNSSIRLVRIP